jgi:hypothetical protein
MSSFSRCRIYRTSPSMHPVVVFRDVVEKDDDFVALDEPLEQRVSWLAYK